MKKERKLQATAVCVHCTVT